MLTAAEKKKYQEKRTYYADAINYLHDLKHGGRIVFLPRHVTERFVVYPGERDNNYIVPEGRK